MEDVAPSVRPASLPRDRFRTCVTGRLRNPHLARPRDHSPLPLLKNEETLWRHLLHSCTVVYVCTYVCMYVWLCPFPFSPPPSPPPTSLLLPQMCVVVLVLSRLPSCLPSSLFLGSLLKAEQRRASGQARPTASNGGGGGGGGGHGGLGAESALASLAGFGEQQRYNGRRVGRSKRAS